ncbi:MAG: ABC transporter permease [Saprospiraceae bacterium]|nr:ABC transporter permease [Saprospiraceae bacterium]
MGPDMNVVNDSYVATLGLKMKSGRSFSKDFPSDSTQSIFVNEAFVKEANWDDPLGKTVKVMNRDPYNVIGVVQDYHFSSLYETVRPQIFTTSPNYGSYGTIFIRLSGKNIPKTLEYIQAKFKVFPNKPYAYDFQSTINEKQYEKEFQMRQIILISASIMIFISCMGLFGLSILTIEKRRKEISIRRVLGANLVNIVRKLTIDFVTLITISFIIFAPLAYLVGNNLLQSYPYRVSISADIFIICFVGIFIITCITISYQAINAALENPIKALKSE